MFVTNENASLLIMAEFYGSILAAIKLGNFVSFVISLCFQIGMYICTKDEEKNSLYYFQFYGKLNTGGEDTTTSGLPGLRTVKF